MLVEGYQRIMSIEESEIINGGKEGFQIFEAQVLISKRTCEYACRGLGLTAQSKLQ
jgi:hypothetical protein